MNQGLLKNADNNEYKVLVARLFQNMSDYRYDCNCNIYRLGNLLEIRTDRRIMKISEILMKNYISDKIASLIVYDSFDNEILLFLFRITIFHMCLMRILDLLKKLFVDFFVMKVRDLRVFSNRNNFLWISLRCFI